MKKIIFIIFLVSIGPIIMVILSYIFFDWKINEFVASLLSVIISLLFVYFQNKESELRKDKIGYYKNLIEVLTVKLSKGELIDEETNIEYCKEINKLSLYASKEVINYIRKINNGEENDAKELLSIIRKDIINTRLENLDKDIMLDFQISDLRSKKNVK